MNNDIPTEEHIAELERQLEEYRILFDSTPIMFWYKDTQNRHIRVNKAAADLEGVEISRLEGVSAYDVYPRELAEAYYQDDLEVMRTGKPKLGIIEKHQRAGSNEMLWLQVGKVPFRDHNGNIVGVIVFAVDITKQVLAEQSVRQMRDVLQQQYQQSQRVNRLLRSTVDDLLERVKTNVPHHELLAYLEHVLVELQQLT
jgi:PAS domain S-box-containing protein